jgi:hypothetical protein
MLHKNKKIITENEDFNLDKRINENKEPNKLLGFIFENSVYRIISENPDVFVKMFGKPGKLVRHDRPEDKYDFKILFDDGSIYYFDVKTRSPGKVTFTVSTEEYPEWLRLKSLDEKTYFFVICLRQCPDDVTAIIEGMWEMDDCNIREGEQYPGFMFYLPKSESMI